MLKFIVFSFALTSAPGYADAPLKTITLKPVQMSQEYKVDGVVEARQQATLSAEVSGKIEAVNFDVDDFVEQGQVVLRIRDQEYVAHIRDQEYVAQQLKARAAVDEANANLQDMQLEFKRNQGLRKQKLISQADFDKSRANLKAARARVASADANLTQADELLDHTVLRAPYSGVVVERHVEVGESTSPGQPINR
jgi:RND family efflux transporter MFP subunit